MNNHLKNQINEMASLDQRIRHMALENNQKTGEEYSQYNALIYIIDGIHQFRIHKIIEEFGYPDVESIGDECLKNFWLLIQHQDFDINLQKRCLENCDFGANERAHLTDRVLLNDGKPKVYGTQFSQNLSDDEKVIFNKNRQEFGLQSI